jgi:UDP-N-acetylglucosamine 1-carboxyvinyltransferase
MAAALTPGVTTIYNAAQEPDIADLGDLLNAMGAEVSGHGTGVLTVEGVAEMHGTEYTVMPDRIEAGTFACAAAITGGDLLLAGARADHLRPVTMKLTECGARVEETARGVRIVGPEGRLVATRLTATPHPGFPTDVQQPLTAALCLAEGTSTVTDHVYESRFRFLTELAKMGARTGVDGRTAIITGVPRLTAADVEATDLRAGAALIVAGLAAEGQTRVFRTEHVERGYENIVDKLKGVGADIWREDEAGRRVGGEGLRLCA